MRHGTAVLFSLPDTFRKEILYLPVDASEIVLSPCGDGIVQLGGKSQRHLLLFSHINKAYLSLQRAERRDFRREQREDLIP